MVAVALACVIEYPLPSFFPDGLPMRIFRHFTELPAEFQGGVVVLGNFDGVHLGHQAVIETARLIARAQNVPLGVMTFEPHPRQVFDPNQPPFRLTPMRIKARHIESLGADFLILQHFDKAFSSHSAEDFVGEILVRHLAVRHVVVGYDYVFGARRGGNCERLEEMSRLHGFGSTCVPAVKSPDGELFSSTRVREYLQAGRVAEAATMMGRPWEIEGRVEHGDARGRTIGFPTANLRLGEYIRPAAGVYAIRAGIDQGAETLWHDGVANYGRRPTFDKTDEILEAHLFDFDGDLYGKHLRVALIDFLRGEQKFDGLEALKAQIAQDAAQARRILSGAE